MTQADVDKGTINNNATASAKGPSGATVVSPVADATVTASRTPGLTVVKAASPATVTAAGQVINYTFTTTNTGNVTLSLLTIVDTLTAPAAPIPTVTCPSSTIAPATIVVCTASYTVTQNDIDAGSIANSAVAKATDPAGNPVTSPPSTATVGTTRSATLQLIKAASPTTVSTAGQIVAYTFTVKNTGNVTATNIAVDDTFIAPGGPALSPITCAGTTLAPDAATTCVASYSVSQADVNNGSIDNSAVATATNPQGVGITSNTSTAVVTATAAPSLSLTKSASPVTYNTSGQTIGYTFTVQNTGNVGISTLAIADGQLGSAVICLATTLAPGATTTCTGTHTVTQTDVDTGRITNTAAATGESPAGATITSPPATATVTSNATATLSLTKSAAPTVVTASDQNVVYTFTVTNTGTVTVKSISIADRFTAPAGPVPVITCAATTLAPGASTTCTTAAYRVTQADVDQGGIANNANANGLDPSNSAVTSNTADAIVTVTQAPAVTIAKSVNPTTATRAGQQVNYSFVVTNTGNVTLNAVTVTDTFTAPAGPALTLSCPVATLAPLASTTCTAIYTVTQADVDAGVITNSAIATGTAPGATPVTSTPSAAVVSIAAGPALALLKTAVPTTYNAPGATVAYSFTVTNTGTVTVSSIAISDPMFTGAKAPVCPATTLAPNASTTCTASYVTSQADVDTGTIVNTATAAGTAPAGGPITSPPSTATVSGVQTPSLSLLKSAAPQSLDAVGDIVIYSFTLTNTGNVTVTDVTVDDVFVLPASGGMVNCPDTTLSPGEVVVCTLNYDSTQADFDTGVITNTATANGVAPGDVNVSSNPSSAVVTANQTPGLSLVKSASPTTVTTVGQSVTYTFAVTNFGTVTVHDLSIADTFTVPAGPEITPVCDSSTLVAGAATTCTATYAVTQADLDNGSINNSALANGLDPSDVPVASAPSTATVDTDTISSLSIVKSASLTTITNAGASITYTFLVTNDGTATSTDVKVVDALLPGASAALCVGGTGTTGPTLAPGATVTCTGTYAATQADIDKGTIVNTANATGRDPSQNITTSPSATATVTVTRAASLAIVKSAAVAAPLSAAGQSVSYSFEVTNTGNVTLTDVSVADVLSTPAGPALTLTCPPNRVLAPGASLTCTAPYTTTQADVDNGSVNNSAGATGTDPSGGLVPSDPSTASVPIAAVAALALVKSVSPSTAAVGTDVTYSFAVTNNSNVTISALAIVDTFTSPAGPVPTITCPVTSLAPAATTICTGTYVITQADVDKGRVDNVATATGMTPARAYVTSNESGAQVTVPQTSSLTIVKGAAPITVDAVGQTVSYTFVVTNTGTTTLTSVAVSDTFTAPAGPPLSITCPATTLAPNASTICTASYVVTQADLDNGAVNNTATASAKNPADVTVTSLQSTATVTAVQTGSLSLVKSASPTTVSANGQTVNYAFLVTNTGTVTVSNLSVTDTFTPPAGPVPSVTCTVTTLAPGVSSTCTATYTVTQADADAGSITNSATASGTAPGTKPVASNPSTVTVTVTQTSAITLTKTALPIAVTAAGQPVAYAFEVTNIGSVTLKNVVIIDQFTSPAGPAPAINCPAATLAPTTSTICTATYSVSQADVDNGVIDNSATVTAKNPAGTTVTSNLSTTTVTVAQNPTLTLVKTASPASVSAAGQTVSYSFAVTNSGNTTITGLAIADTFTAPAGPDLVITCPQTLLTPGEGATCTSTYQVTQGDVDRGRIDNSATATGLDPRGATVASNASAAAVTAPRRPMLNLVKSANVSTVTVNNRAVTYSFKVTNAGNTTLTAIAVIDVFTAPAGPELTPVCPVTTLAPGAFTTCTADYTVTNADFDAGSIANTARATATDPADAAVTSSPSSVVITAAAQPSVSLIKKATVTDVNQNDQTDRDDTITWAFTVTNTGNVTLGGLAVDDVTAGTVTCPTLVLAAGGSTTCTADAKHVISQADVDAGVVNNTATVSGTDPFATTVTSLPSSTSTPIDTSSALTIVKSASPSTITAAGQTIAYSFTVTNAGNQTITSLAVTDTFTAPAAPALAITCPQTTVPVGGAVVCTATYTSTQADVDNGSINNTAAATGKNPAGDTVTTAPSTATVTATRTATLALTKSAAPTLVTAAGQMVTYSFMVTNTGNVTVGDLSIADTLTAPAGPALVVTCPATTLLPGASTICTAGYTVTQADVDNGTITNVAMANGTDPRGVVVASKESDATVTDTPAGALTLVKSVSPTIVTTAGQTLSYSFLVSNSGNVTVSGLTITDSFTAPAGPDLVITCPVAPLAPGASTTCSGNYTVTQEDLDRGAIDNSATATGTDPAGTTVTSNQSTAAVGTSLTPTLTVAKSVAPTTVTAAGQSVTYSFLVTNTGNVTLKNLTINDTFTAPAGPVPTINCPVTTLSPTASTTCTASYSATQADVDAGSITNSATASALDPAGDPVTSSPSAATVTIPPAAALDLVKSASPGSVDTVGQTVTYDLLVTNTGNVTITNLAIEDQFTAPAGPALIVTCPVTSLAPVAETTCTAAYAVTQADLDNRSISNSAVARGASPTGANVASGPSTATVPTVLTPALTIVKTASPTTVSTVGQMVTYSFLVTNTGNATINSLAVTDVLSAPAAPELTVNCPVTRLAPLATTTCTAGYTVRQADLDNGAVSNSATVSGKDPSGASTTSPPSTATVSVTQTPALTLVKSAAPTTVAAAGTTVTYSFLVINTGNVTVSNLGIADTLSPPAAPGLTVTCPVTTLAPKATTICTASYTVTQADIDNGTITNAATASGTDPNGVLVPSEPSSATVAINQTPALTVVKTSSPTTVTAAGQSVTYSFAVTNTGNTTITGLSVTDVLTAPARPELTVTCPASTLAPTGTTTCTATYSVKQADIDAGVIVNAATVRGTPPSGPPITSPPSSATVAVTQTPTLTLAKSASPTTVTAAGQTVTYSFVVTNTGNTTVTNLSVQDTFTVPAGPVPTISCPVTSLAPAGATTCTATYTVTQPDVDKGRIDNSAVAAGTAPLGGSVTSAPSTASVIASQTPALNLVKTASPTTIAAAGAVVNYGFLVTNTGNTTVTNLKITDVFTPAKPGLTVRCPVTTLAPGATTTCALSYPATQDDVNRGVIANTATVAGTAPGNTPVQSGPSTTAVTAPAAPALTVVKRASSDTVTMIGQVLAYSVRVTNTGNVTITDVTINDTLTAPAGPALVVTCPSSTLDPGRTTTCTASYTVTAADFDNGTVTNSATATGNPPAGPPTTSPASTVTVVATQLPSIRLTKTATPNDLNDDGVIGLDDTIGWTFAVTNTGNVTLTAVAVDDAVAGAVTCPAEPLPAGASETCSADVAYVITQVDVDAGRVDNTATVSGTGAGNNGARVASDPSSTTTPIGGRPSLVLVKSGSVVDSNADGRVDAGDQIRFAFKVINTGNVTISALIVTDPTAGSVTCAVTTLAPGVSTSCRADVAHTITQRDVDAGSYSNTATSRGVDPMGDPVPSPPSTATVPLPGDGQLSLVKSATVTDENGNGVSDAGDRVVWSFLITNIGTVTVTGIAVDDPTAGRVTCPSSALEPGQRMTCRSSVHVITGAESDSGTLSNTATVTGSTPDGGSVTSPPSSAMVTTAGADNQGTNNPGTGNGTGSGSGTAFTGVDNLPGLVELSVWSLLLGMLLLALGFVGRFGRRRKA